MFRNSSQPSYLKQILDNSPDGMFTIDLELQIRYVNPAFCRLLGYEQAELLGSPITEHLGDLNILENCMVQVSECGHCNDQETIFRRKDGSMVHISKNVQAISDDSGNVNEILVSIRDLTDLHLLNKELEESKRELENKNLDLERTLDDLRNTQQQLVESEKLASLGGLVAGIAHEINTPLGVSVTSSTAVHESLNHLQQAFHENTLKRTELEAFLEDASKACRILNTNLHRASNLVRSFKQVAVDQFVDDHRTINLHEYLKEVLMSIGPSINPLIQVDMECDNNIELNTQPGAIYQIISNLVMNAVIHGFDKEQQGKISIGAFKQNDRIVIECRDNGKGISEENLKHIFTPFFTTRRGSGGSGLGLSIVYNLVTGTLHGNIQANSSLGTGSTFIISLPAAS